MSFTTGGSFPALIKPAQQKLALNDNYLDFTGSGNDFAQQYLPELYEQEVERYGNRTLGGFLRMVGAEMPMTSDQVIWSEQNRLHVAYETVDTAAIAGAANAQRMTVTLNLTDADAPSGAVRAGQSILISDKATGLVTAKGLVQSVGGATNNALVVTLYETTYANMSAVLKGTGVASLFVYGSEYAKGSLGMSGSIEPQFTQFSNSPIILKDNFEINGSDAAQIGWIEVATEDGTSGYLWYLKSESETRLRFDDYLEMSMVEAVKYSGADQNFDYGNSGTVANVKGSEGLFSAIEARGNVYSGFAGAAAPGSGAMGDFDAILKQLDKQGAIEENMLFLSRSTALDFDDMVAAMNGGFASSQAASYGLFDNEEDMALNFGFSGFRRGSYDFYKTDWKYLNDATTRGLDNEIDGVMIPAGTTTVYDQMMGVNIRRPFLHIRYRASETEDRRYKSWITGSVGGAYTSDLDAMKVNFLSERCLVVQAANNFVLFKGA
tara:strand:- start:4743 stop:6221 length:1479 start_codon:yes stop_codon:yes gene_type:complete